MPGPGTWAAGDILTAADLNAIGTWTTYTPVLKSGATSIPCTVNYAEYCVINKMCALNVKVTSTGTAAGNAVVSVSLPFTASSASTTGIIGSGYYYDSSATDNILLFALASSSTIVFGSDASTSVDGGNAFGNNPNMTIGINDVVNCSVVYQVA